MTAPAQILEPKGARSSPPSVVRSLVCHAHVDMAVRCLGSFVRQAEESYRLAIHDDGTLDAADIDRLESSIPGATVVRRSEWEDSVLQAIALYPRVRQAREASVLALKLIDCVLAHQDPVFRFVDTDIYWFRPHRGVFDLGPGRRMRLMQDPYACYSISSANAHAFSRRRIGRRLNSGLIAWRLPRDPLPDLEATLGLPGMFDWAGLTEQTAFAALEPCDQVEVYDPSFFALATPGRPTDPRWICAHFFSPGRHQMDDWISRIEGRTPHSPPTLPIVPSRRCRPATYRMEKLWRRWATRRWSRKV